DTFIVENGSEGLWVWVGKKATQKERQSAIKYAMELINKKKYPNNTPVTKVMDGDESVEFKSLFESWQMTEQEKITNARLFRVSRNGIFKQVANYEQDDLEEDNVMILGMFSCLFRII
ncbi:Group 16 mite allergen-like protein (Gelsolin-like), partial [Euroglyphus maynei]